MDTQTVWLILFGVGILALVIWAIAKKPTREAEKVNRENETSGEAYRRLHGAFRGELGSPGTSPSIVGKHSVNCECNICLHRT
jgi:hypothetical protein